MFDLDIVYLRDRMQFFDINTGKLLSERDAAELLRLNNPSKFFDESAIQRELAVYRDAATSYTEAKRATDTKRRQSKLTKKREEHVSDVALYKEVKDILPY